MSEKLFCHGCGEVFSHFGPRDLIHSDRTYQDYYLRARFIPAVGEFGMAKFAWICPLCGRENFLSAQHEVRWIEAPLHPTHAEYRLVMGRDPELYISLDVLRKAHEGTLTPEDLRQQDIRNAERRRQEMDAELERREKCR